MEETRIKKYKEYRSKLVKDDLDVLETPLQSDTPKRKEEERKTKTTISVPYDDIMAGLEEDVPTEKKHHFNFKIFFISLMTIIVVVAIVLLGVFLFTK